MGGDGTADVVSGGVDLAFAQASAAMQPTATASADLLRAAGLFKVAAEGGHVRAQYNLGIMYAKGMGVEKDLLQATHWLTKAFAQGHPKADAALNALGAATHDAAAAAQPSAAIQPTATVPADPVRQAGLFKAAAEGGEVRAQYNLGIMYARGVGVEKDLLQATDWLIKALAQGHPKADAALNALGITTHDVAAAGAVPAHAGHAQEAFRTHTPLPAHEGGTPSLTRGNKPENRLVPHELLPIHIEEVPRHSPRKIIMAGAVVILGLIALPMLMRVSTAPAPAAISVPGIPDGPFRAGKANYLLGNWKAENTQGGELRFSAKEAVSSGMLEGHDTVPVDQYVVAGDSVTVFYQYNGAQEKQTYKILSRDRMMRGGTAYKRK